MRPYKHTKEHNEIEIEEHLSELTERDLDLGRGNVVYLQQQEIEKLYGYSDPTYRGREKG